jgi:hypothetical protein
MWYARPTCWAELTLHHNRVPVTLIWCELSWCLLVQFLSPKACYKFTDGQYPRTISLQVIDRYGRKSNVVSRSLIVDTGTIHASANWLPRCLSTSAALPCVYAVCRH